MSLDSTTNLEGRTCDDVHDRAHGTRLTRFFRDPCRSAMTQPKGRLWQTGEALSRTRPQNVSSTFDYFFSAESKYFVHRLGLPSLGAAAGQVRTELAMGCPLPRQDAANRAAESCLIVSSSLRNEIASGLA